MKATSTRRPGERMKTIDEAVHYAVKHRLRVQILITLNEGTFTPGQIAEITGEPLNNVANHVRELADAGSIELAKTELVRNATLHFYRAVEMPFFTDEQIAAMPPLQRHVSAGLVVQSMIAEVFAALWAGKLSDPRVWLTWRWFNVDDQGRRDMLDEQQRSWNRIQEIEAESTNRRAVSGEESASIIVTQLAFPRARKGPTPSSPSREDEYPQ